MGDKAVINTWLHVLQSGRREGDRVITQGYDPFFPPALGLVTLSVCRDTPLPQPSLPPPKPMSSLPPLLLISMSK